MRKSTIIFAVILSVFAGVAHTQLAYAYKMYNDTNKTLAFTIGFKILGVPTCYSAHVGPGKSKSYTKQKAPFCNVKSLPVEVVYFSEHGDPASLTCSHSLPKHGWVIIRGKFKPDNLLRSFHCYFYNEHGKRIKKMWMQQGI